MALISFPFSATRLERIDRILVANSTAVITMSGIFYTKGYRVIAIGIVCVTDGCTSVLCSVILADSYGVIISITVFTDSYAILFRIGLMTNSHGRTAFCLHITT